MYHLKLYDYFHYMEEDETYNSGSYETLEEATDAARLVVQDFLFHNYKKGTAIDKLFTEFSMFGEEPVIVCDKTNSLPDFSSTSYAKELLADFQQTFENPQIPVPDLYQKAILFAAQKHKSQFLTDTDLPYLVHLSNVANEIFNASQGLNLHFAIPVSLLHDILEDTETTYTELSAEFGPLVAAGVTALTKNKHLPKSEQISDSLARIQKLPIEIAAVKMADRITNLQKPPKSWTPTKITDYLEQAKLIHSQLYSSHEILANRLASKIEAYL